MEDHSEEQIATAIDLVVVTRRLAGGRRVVTSLSEVSRGAGGEAVLDECVTFDASEGTWSMGHEPGFVASAVLDGVLEEGEVRRWRSCFR